MTSEKRVQANRANAHRSTGPRTASGRTKSAGNARRHGLTAIIVKGSPEALDIEVMARRILSDTPKYDETWEAALAAAAAQSNLNHIRKERLRLLKVAEERVSTYAGPPKRSDSMIMRETLKKGWRGKDIGSPALQELFFRLRGRIPRDHLKRHVQLFTKLADQIEKFDKYADRALGRRRSALRELDRLRVLCPHFGVES